ncbi:hypothetical protein TcWFU_006895 [Taenia crassiceps]|uniref:Uncharacterized protein n=1 Tax=Taenia crassiceps TaxID=6207 RepID=A0ABR4Q9S7_9CEST
MVLRGDNGEESMEALLEDSGDQDPGASASSSNVGELDSSVGGPVQPDPPPGQSNTQITTPMERESKSASAPVSSPGAAGAQPRPGSCPSDAQMVVHTVQGPESATSPVSASGQSGEKSTCSPSLSQSQESTQSTEVNPMDPACSVACVLVDLGRRTLPGVEQSTEPCQPSTSKPSGTSQPLTPRPSSLGQLSTSGPVDMAERLKPWPLTRVQSTSWKPAGMGQSSLSQPPITRVFPSKRDRSSEEPSQSLKAAIDSMETTQDADPAKLANLSSLYCHLYYPNARPIFRPNGEFSLEMFPVPKYIFDQLCELCEPLKLELVTHEEHKYSERKTTLHEFGLYQAMSVRLVQRILTLHHGMTFTRVPLAPFPALSLEVLHSRDFFSCTGPLLIVVQGCNESAPGVWEPTHLTKEGSDSLSRNLKTGSQIEFVKLAHNRGYRVAFLNLNCLAAETSVPEEYSARTDTLNLNCDIFPSREASQSHPGPSDRFSALVYLQRTHTFICDVSSVTLEERLACGWEALLARCRSSNIVVWVHRRAEESFLYPLCPIPQSSGKQPSIPRTNLGPRVPNIRRPIAAVNSGDVSSEPGHAAHLPEFQQSSGGASSPPPADTHKSKIMAAWCDRARAHWLSLQSRVKAVAFVDPCQMFTDFSQCGVGWGLLHPETAASAQALAQQDINLVREWFAKNAVQYVPSNLAVGEPVPLQRFRKRNLPTFSAGTKENDLIHTYVMTSVLNFFDQKSRGSAAPGGSEPLSSLL